MVFIDPFHNYTAAAMEGKWIAPRLGTDAALAMAIAYVWLTEGTYDKEYVADRTVGFEEFKNVRPGRERRSAQDARVGGRRNVVCRRAPSGPGPGVGREAHGPFGRRAGRRGRSLPAGLRHRMGADDGPPPGHAGSGQARRQHLGHHHGRPQQHQRLVPRLRRPDGRLAIHPVWPKTGWSTR